MVITIYQLLPPAPFDGVARVAERVPIHAAILAVACVALQGIPGRLYHVCGGPVHVCGGEIVLTAVFETGDGRSQFEGAVPIEGGPEAALARGDRLEQIFVHCVVWLFGDV